MTENEARFLTGESPTEHAAQLCWFTGRSKAIRMVLFQLQELSARPLTFVNCSAIEFWAAVLKRLGSGDVPALEPSPRRLAALKCIEERMR